MWPAAEGPNLVGSIFKEGATEYVQRKTERFGYLERDSM